MHVLHVCAADCGNVAVGLKITVDVHKFVHENMNKLMHLLLRLRKYYMIKVYIRIYTVGFFACSIKVCSGLPVAEKE